MAGGDGDEKPVSEELPQTGPRGLPSAVPDQAALPDEADGPTEVPRAVHKGPHSSTPAGPPPSAQVMICW